LKPISKQCKYRITPISNNLYKQQVLLWCNHKLRTFVFVVQGVVFLGVFVLKTPIGQ